MFEIIQLNCVAIAQQKGDITKVIIPFFISMEKKDISKSILAIGVIAVIGWLTGKTILAKKVSFFPSNVSIDGNLLHPTLNLNLTANNPTQFTATVNQVFGNIKLPDGTPLGTVTSNAVTKIQAYGNSDIPLSINLIFTGILDTLNTLLSAQKLAFNFEGYAIVDNIQLPISFNYSM